jgi:membrane-bound lytic murein transglycosylase D
VEKRVLTAAIRNSGKPRAIFRRAPARGFLHPAICLAAALTLFATGCADMRPNDRTAASAVASTATETPADPATAAPSQPRTVSPPAFAATAPQPAIPPLDPPFEIKNRPALPHAIDLVSESADIWERMRNGFAMPDLDSPLVLDRQAYYLNHPEYVKRMIERSRPYLYFIVAELEKRGMPTELALLPIVESAYNPMALSRSHASGMWQFVPSTGKRYDLKQNWWFDDRRDVIASTTAALDYLQSIYEMNGDWYLALASYNWGENAVARAVAKNQARGLKTDYLSLTMPTETRYYVPKLQAIKNIIANPALFGIELPAIPNRPYFTTVETSQDIDVRLAAKLAEMPLDQFLALNPANNRPVISSQAKSVIVLPTDKLDVFNTNLEAHQSNEKPLSSWRTISLKAGDKIEKIAASHGVSVAKLKAINGLKPKAKFKTGQTVLVPVAGTSAVYEPLPVIIPAVASEPVRRAPYVVKKGDTLASIANRFGVSTDDLRRWNKAAQGRITPGIKLSLQPPHAAAKKTSAGGKAGKKTAKSAQSKKQPAKKS